MAKASIPKAAALRLSLYLREVEALLAAGAATVSSGQLAESLGLTAAQVRKDLARFGQLGRAGIGYPSAALAEEFRRILGTDQMRPVALVGAGNLGRALATYSGFERRGFKITALLDNDLRKVGRQYGGLIVQDIAKLHFVCQRDRIRLAILAVPGSAAQDVADLLVRAGIQGLLNFSPVRLETPAEVVVSTVALSLELEQLGLAVRLRNE
jgi:redox-sensing transcriptional repressor